MKASRPSLILYFTALFFTILFDIFQYEYLTICTKSIVVPSIFFYFYSSNNFKINKTQILIFILCFIGEVFHLMDIEISDLASLLCFLLVYMTLFKMIVIDYDKKKIRFKRSDILPITMIVLLIIYLLFSVLSLQFDKMRDFHFIYSFYGIVLGSLGFVCYAHYITKGSYITLMLTLMVTCFIFSDIFFIFNEYFSYTIVFSLIMDITQIMSYFFMVKFFILSSKKRRFKQ